MIKSSISIHAPRVGSDVPVFIFMLIGSYHFNPRSPCGERLSVALAINGEPLFQSTLPVWGATTI